LHGKLQAHPKYEFKYGVNDTHTQDIKEQAEKRDGDKVEGYYKLVEPDGNTRTVHYTSDKHKGFHAQVVRSGYSLHPVQQKNLVFPLKKVKDPVRHQEISAPSSSHEPSHSAGTSISYVISGFSRN
jgi:hypothetical protein